MLSLSRTGVPPSAGTIQIAAGAMLPRSRTPNRKRPFPTEYAIHFPSVDQAGDDASLGVESATATPPSAGRVKSVSGGPAAT